MLYAVSLNCDKYVAVIDCHSKCCNMISIPILYLIVLISTTPLATSQETQCLCFDELQGARNTTNPLLLRHAGDGTKRRFVAEQPGFVWVIAQDGSRLQTPFLNLSHLIELNPAYDERGLLSLAFHPNHHSNRKVFLYYSIAESDGRDFTVMTSILVNETNRNVVDYNSQVCRSAWRISLCSFQVELYRMQQPQIYRNGGDLIFDLDGFLTLSTGDGGHVIESDVAQNLSSPFGKILRFDVNRSCNNLSYCIPPDNPFTSENCVIGPTETDKGRPLCEIYAWGFRQPWRGAYDRGDRNSGQGRGRIFYADVGEDTYEEINMLQRGGNYMWAIKEGPACYRRNKCTGPPGCNTTTLPPGVVETCPIHWYAHTPPLRAAIGGVVYRGASMPGMNGWYLFADWNQEGTIFRLREDAQQNWSRRQVPACSPITCSSRGWTSKFTPFINSFGEDEDGEIYICGSFNPSPFETDGHCYKIHSSV